MSYYGPILLTVAATIFYQICAKSTPEALSPLGSLPLTYLVAAVVSGILYYVLEKDGNILREFQNANWTSYVLGVAIVGMEIGSIYMYKVGWNVNTGYVVQSILVATLLIVVGLVLYKEAISFRHMLGLVICMIGMYFINK